MKTSEFNGLLQSHPDKAFRLVLPDQSTVPVAFHITEVAHIQKRFIDCGGKRHQVDTCQLQAWLGEDTDHRLSTGKMTKVMELACVVLPEGQDLDIEIEYEDTMISQYPVARFRVDDEAVVLDLASKHTDCLARELLPAPAQISEALLGSRVKLLRPLRLLLAKGSLPMKTMKTVLFVCVHNAGRSQMAEAFTNHVAAERGLAVRGLSAGTEGGAQINPQAATAMAELGISMTGQHPKLLTQAMVDSADRVITMGCGVDAETCPARFHLSEDWGLDDPKNASLEQVRAIRDQIRIRVESLLSQLSETAR